MKTVEVSIKGISPLLMHKYPMVQIEALEKKSAEEQAEHAAYRNGDGNLFIPGTCVQRALVGAAAYSKGKGRASLVKVAAAAIFVSPEVVDLGVKKYTVDSRPVVISATRGRIVRHRPRLDEWEATFTVEWDNDLMTEEQVRRIVDDAGQRVGLLDFRPACKGPFGRFIVTAWES